MSDKIKDLQRIEYRLAVIDAQSKQILTTVAAAGPILPRVTVLASSRVAEALTETIEKIYHLRTIQLTLLPGAEGQSYCAVHEIVDSREAVSTSLSFSELHDIVTTEFVGKERATVLAIMRGDANEFGRFARLGWIDELLAKMGDCRGQRSRPIIRQLNQGIDFCLLSLTDVSGCKTWFKAVGGPNAQEYSLTMELAGRFPNRLPQIRLAIPQWNGWVMEDVLGIPLNRSTNRRDRYEAVVALASMQQESLNGISALYAAGAQDWTCGRLHSLVEPVFADAALAMRAQTSSRVAPLTKTELQRLKVSVEVALSEFATSGIPETMLHGDIGHGNVIATPNGPVFLDWAETYVGHPFLCSEHLIADLERSHRFAPCETRALRLRYAECWRNYARADQLAKVTALAPAVAAFAYAVMVWEAHRSRPNPALAWPTLRAMLRRTKCCLEDPREVVA